MKTIVITGASRGIGRALTQKFLDQGDFVIGTSRTGTAGFEHPNLLFFPLEMTDTQSIEACANAIANLNKEIGVLINNAGIWHPKDNHKTIEMPTLRETLEANLLGPIHFTEHVLPLMSDGSHIINLSSRRGSMSYTTESLYPCYGISKAALNMFTRNLAARLKGRLTVSCVHPGYVKTDMNDGAGDITAEEAANDIYQLAGSNVETGQFWFKGEKFPW